MPIDITGFLTKEEFDSDDWKPLRDATQGHILAKHRRSHVWNIFLRFVDPTRARKVLASLVPQLASVSRLRAERDHIRAALNEKKTTPSRPIVCFLGLSSAGTNKLGIADENFVRDFR